MAPENVTNERIIAVQIYDGTVIAEWTMYEWIAELELFKQKEREKITLAWLYRIGIRETDQFKGTSLVDV